MDHTQMCGKFPRVIHMFQDVYPRTRMVAKFFSRMTFLSAMISFLPVNKGKTVY